MSSSSDFPCSLDLSVPFPSARLANIALQTLQVDKELSPLVQRHITLGLKRPLENTPETPSENTTSTPEIPLALESQSQSQSQSESQSGPDRPATLEVRYRAATNRMLRVAVNSFLDSLGLAVEVMQHLDEDVLAAGAGAGAGADGPGQAVEA